MSSTLTSVKPWAAGWFDNSIADTGVVGAVGPPFVRHIHPFRHSMPYCVQITTLDRCRDRRAIQTDYETDTDTELVTETLVEEVSIDGMCGVCEPCRRPHQLAGLVNSIRG